MGHIALGNPFDLRLKWSGTQAYRLSAQCARRPGFDTAVVPLPF